MSNPVFKPNNQGEILLFPSSLDSMISHNHLVRMINTIVDKMDLSDLLSGYLGGGTSCYHPRMLLKVLLYAFCLKIYSGRKIAHALIFDITFMWLSGGQTPNFRTLNSFRSGRMKNSIDSVFKSLLVFMFEEGFIHFEEYYCDGTTIQADANKHKVVWKKNQARYREVVESHIDDTLAQIDALIKAENATFEEDASYLTGNDDPTREDRVKEAIGKLNNIVNKNSDKKLKKQVDKLTNKLECDLIRGREYQEKENACGARSGYSKSDPEATPMRTKECVDDLRPSYNGMIGCEGQFITGVSLHQNPNDGTCFKEHINQSLAALPIEGKDNIKVIIADAAFGTEENYEFLQEKKIEALLKYPSYDKEQTSKFKEDIFHRDNMPYDPLRDSFTCANGKDLFYIKNEKQVNSNGFVSTLRIYECEDCRGCPFFEKCGSKREEWSNRKLQVNMNLERYKQLFRDKLESAREKKRMRQRGCQVETCFGDIKHNQLFRRAHLRGLKKVKTEFTLVAMAHNIRKMAIVRLQQTA